MYGLTLAESKQLMLKYLDEYSIGGELISAAENADYLNRHNAFADTVQMSLAQLFPIASEYQINQRAVDSLISCGSFDLYTNIPGKEHIVYTDKGAGAYYFEVSGPVTVYIEEFADELWVLRDTVENSGNDFSVYRGNISNSFGNVPARLRFVSEYPAMIKNCCLYSYAFPDNSSVPSFRPWIRYEMPNDFLRLDELILENEEQYCRGNLYYWENEKVLVLPHDVSADISVRYWAYPPKIDANTADDYVFPLAPEVARLIPLKVAALVIPMEKNELSLRLLQLYEQELSRIKNEKAAKPNKIVSVYRQ